MTGHPDDAPARALKLHRIMLLIRQFEQRAERAQREGEIPGTLHLSIGQEAVAAGVCSALGKADLITSTHRGHGHAIAKGASVAAMMAELFGRASGTCRGKGGSMHIADFSVGMLGANGVVGGGIGIAVGAAQGLRVRQADAVVVSFFGDGAINRGPFLEALNWAATFCLPVLFVCEDNGFAAFSRTQSLTAGPGPTARAEALGVHSVAVDGNDVLAVADAASELVARVRAGGGPSFLHARTYRLCGHTITDKGAYRDADEHARHEAREPIALMSGQLEDMGLSSVEADLRKSVAAEIDDAVTAARRAPLPDLSAAFADVQDLGAPA